MRKLAGSGEEVKGYQTADKEGHSGPPFILRYVEVQE
jgi:hypothetical protein